jgi:AhpD family alkylhydroperoxidase
MPEARDLISDLAPKGRQLRQLIPKVYAGYQQMDAAAYEDGALSPKVKQLIALAIAVTRECDGCIATHARSVAREKAIAMNGGPGTVWAPRALAAFLEFSEEAQA